MLAPVVRQRKGQHEKILERIRKEGFTRVRVDGEIHLLEEDEIKLEKTFKHTIEIVVDRIKVKDGVQSRLSEACELAIAHGVRAGSGHCGQRRCPGRKDIQHQVWPALIMASALKNWSRGCFPSTTRWGSLSGL